MNVKSLCKLFGLFLYYIDFFILQKVEVRRTDTGKPVWVQAAHVKDLRKYLFVVVWKNIGKQKKQNEKRLDNI